MDRLIRGGVLCLLSIACGAQTSPLAGVLADEMDRNFRVLKEKGDPAAYFLAYEVVDRDSCAVSATLGALQGTGCSHGRYLDVTVRVGDPKLDNYRLLPGDTPQFTSAVQIPIEDGIHAVRQRAWIETDRTYRQASERLIKLRTSTQVKLTGEDTPADFSAEEPVTASEKPDRLDFGRPAWEEKIRRWSAPFEGRPEILTSSVSVLAQREIRWFVNTDGTRLQHGAGLSRIAISAQARAADGMDLVTGESFEASSPAGLPGDKTVLSAVDRVAADLRALLDAPVAEPFVGPAILSGHAAGVFFHEIFGHRVEGHRQKDETEGQTFTKSVGNAVLPEFLSVYFDPTEQRVNGTDLNGHYLFDNEGVRARKVVVVDKGILKTFLMSRSPIKGFDHSNGHGRRAPGFEVVSRQSNLIVESGRQVPETRLRAMLIDEIRRQGKPYGLYFRKVTGGYTQTRRHGLQAFTVIPLIVYRVYPDGRPDELVRGADIVGTPLASFSKILATSDSVEVFNGYCGAESGSVPVSAVSPALLVSEIEIQKKDTSLDRRPLLPRPSAAPGGGQ